MYGSGCSTSRCCGFVSCANGYNYILNVVLFFANTRSVVLKSIKGILRIEHNQPYANAPTTLPPCIRIREIMCKFALSHVCAFPAGCFPVPYVSATLQPITP